MSAETALPPAGIAAFLLGSAGMFATMYSTQAILPELSREFDVSPSVAGLSVSVVVLSVALGAWIWGPVSDRIGRTRAIRCWTGWRRFWRSGLRRTDDRLVVCPRAEGALSSVLFARVAQHVTRLRMIGFFMEPVTNRRPPAKC